jgi:hypothetical protein
LDVQGAISIDQDSIELDIHDDGTDDERIPPQFGIKSGWSPLSKVMGTSDHFRYSTVVGETTTTSRAVSFYFLLNS